MQTVLVLDHELDNRQEFGRDRTTDSSKFKVYSLPFSGCTRHTEYIYMYILQQKTIKEYIDRD